MNRYPQIGQRVALLKTTVVQNSVDANLSIWALLFNYEITGYNAELS